MKTLFDETQMGQITLKNRFIRSATHEGMAGLCFSDCIGNQCPCLTGWNKQKS